MLFRSDGDLDLLLKKENKPPPPELGFKCAEVTTGFLIRLPEFESLDFTFLSEDELLTFLKDESLLPELTLYDFEGAKWGRPGTDN